MESKTIESIQIALIKALRKDTLISNGIKVTQALFDNLIVSFREKAASLPVISYCNDVWWYVGTHYERVDQKTLDHIVDMVCEDLGISSRFWFSIHSRIWGRVKMIGYDDIDHSKVSCQNGVLDFSTGAVTLYRHDPSFYTFFVLPYKYVEGTECPIFNAFLSRVVPDYAMRKHLQELCGCVFLDRHLYHVEKMGVLYGTGANGKSTFADVICGVLGRKNVSYYSLSALTVDPRHQANIFAIGGKLLNWCTDISAKSIGNSEVKSLISGETQIGRELYKEPVEIYDIPLIMCNVNHLPSISDPAVARRLAIFPFNVTIPEEERDVTLASQMEKEYPAILDWMLEGMRRLSVQEYQFTQCEAMTNVSREATITDDPLTQCLADNGLFIYGDKEIRVTLDDIRKMLDTYVNNCGGQRMTTYRIGRKLKEAGCKKYRFDGATGYVLFRRNFEDGEEE